jgi:coenzyme F420-reducing hydrogenase gamma subunit
MEGTERPLQAQSRTDGKNIMGKYLSVSGEPAGGQGVPFEMLVGVCDSRALMQRAGVVIGNGSDACNARCPSSGLPSAVCAVATRISCQTIFPILRLCQL